MTTNKWYLYSQSMPNKLQYTQAGVDTNCRNVHVAILGDKWQLYSQAGVNGAEYGVRIRPGYVVVGFQKEDAQQIVSWQNASIRPAPEGDILERAIDELEAKHALFVSPGSTLEAALIRIKELEAENLQYKIAVELGMSRFDGDFVERLEAAFLEERMKSFGEYDGKCFDTDCKCPDSADECSGCKLYEKARAALEELRRNEGF